MKPEKKPIGRYCPKQFKVVSIRECPMPQERPLVEAPCDAYTYWVQHIATDARFDPEVESFVILLLNTRRRLKGHVLIAVGTVDSTIVHPRECFRSAIVSASSGILAMHNHPSGDPAPSEADIKVTRDLIRAGQLLKIDLVDHVIVGHERFVSLRELGFFFS